MEGSIVMRSADAVKVTVNLRPDVSVSFISVYRLHAYSISEFLNELYKIFVYVKDNNVILAGDINICTLKYCIQTILMNINLYWLVLVFMN